MLSGFIPSFTRTGHNHQAPCICTEEDERHIVKAEYPVTGRSDAATCLAISGNVIASGSFDRTMQRWDIRSGGSIGSPLRGHDRKAPRICTKSRCRMTVVKAECPVTGHEGDIYCVAIWENILASGSSAKPSVYGT